MNQQDHNTQITTALITGASTGIGAVYADRLARRGHNLVLVARNAARMEELAAKLRQETGVQIEVIGADLTKAADLARVEARLRDHRDVGILINNAGAAAPGGFETSDVEAQDNLIKLNITALTRLGAAVVPRFLAQGQGAIVNIASVVLSLIHI